MSRRILLSSIITVMLFFVFQSCADDDNVDDIAEYLVPPAGTSKIDASPQRTGDATAGYNYLVNGDYIDSGIPYDLFFSTTGGDDRNLLNRTGNNATVPFDYNATTAFNGVEIVAPSCLQCHAQEFNGELIVGLGNTIADYTFDQSGFGNLLENFINLSYGANSPEADAFEFFQRGIQATGPNIITEVVGVNPADKIAAILAAHRDQNDLTWKDVPQFEIPSVMVPTDVPAWWLLKKKASMFYTSVGRGDFARIMMASSLLVLQDTTKAREVDENFDDVLAFINSIEAPIYPNSIDQIKADKGEDLFIRNCAKCHGTYGVEETYPDLLVELDVVKTDPALAQTNYANPDFVNIYNESWFGKGQHAARLEPTTGYIAPPLDGVWITAPYLHNGSIPTLEELLNSSQRPTYFKRILDTNLYDFEKVGIKYDIANSGEGTDVYDTTIPGYQNIGHTFGDGFTDEERSNLIEYLKTL